MNTYERRKKRDIKVNEIDDFISPNSSYPQKPRTSALSKPHSDYSILFCPSNSSLPHHQDHQESAANKEEELPTIMESSPVGEKDTEADIRDLPLAHWIRSLKRRKAVPSETPTMEDSSITKLELVQTQSKSDIDTERTTKGKSLQVVMEKSTITTCSDVLSTPGSVVSARKPYQQCWPAEASAHQKEQLSADKELIASSQGSEGLNVPDQLHDSQNISNLSRTETDYMERGRGKRKRKPKLHFDEINVPEKKARRLRIMRYLGLAPPVGSPFVKFPVQEK